MEPHQKKTSLSLSRSLVHRETWRLKVAVHWERPGCALAQSSPNVTWTAMGLRADSARPQRVSGSACTDSRRAESARNPIASHAKFGDDSALNALTRTQWTAAFTGRCVYIRYKTQDIRRCLVGSVGLFKLINLYYFRRKLVCAPRWPT